MEMRHFPQFCTNKLLKQQNIVAGNHPTERLFSQLCSVQSGTLETRKVAGKETLACVMNVITSLPSQENTSLTVFYFMLSQ